MKILLAEDEADLREVVAEMLAMSGYAVDAVENGREALESARAGAYDAMVLDIMMPEMDGLTAVREIRRGGDRTPVLFLTAKAEVDDRIEGLDAGADDYLPKPFAMKELLARIRAMTRRSGDYAPRMLSYGDTSLDVEKARLSSVNSISLAVRECRLMEHFMANPGVMFQTEELLEKFWQEEAHGDDTKAAAVTGDGADVVWMYVSFLQGKLEAIGAGLVIEGERGGSYVLREK